MIQRLFGTHASDLDYQAYSPIIVYINGTYNGIFGMRERVDDDFVESNYNGLEDIYTATHESYELESKEWETSSFGPLYYLYTDSASTYAQMTEQIDVENFMESLITEIFANNNDFPNNNVFMWRPKASDGKWRWILKDLDMCGTRLDRSVVYFNMFKFLFGQVSENDLEYKWANRANLDESAAIYRKMMSFKEFREPFIDKFAVWLGDFLKPLPALCPFGAPTAPLRTPFGRSSVEGRRGAVEGPSGGRGGVTLRVSCRWRCGGRG